MAQLNTPELREHTAQILVAASDHVRQLSAFVGLDGFVDEIIHIVDERADANNYTRLETIGAFGERVSSAAGKSTNFELVTQKTKLGGNGPIMANALATLGLKVTYVGALGYPNLHPVFKPFAERAEVHSVAESGHTDALEFLDGKLMLGKSFSLKDITWTNIQERYGRDRFERAFSHSALIGFVNWTMIPYMSDIWESLLTELCPLMTGPRRRIFFDLADPQKRSHDDINRALRLMSRFQEYFDVTLGLNEKEACEVAEVMNIRNDDHSPESIARLGQEIFARIKIDTLVIHPVTYAFAVQKSGVAIVNGPGISKPLITTGAGDHFNSGFCVGQLLGMDAPACVLLGVATSGYYVKTAQTPTLTDLAGMLRNWPS